MKRLACAAALVLVPLVGSPPSADAARPMCQGKAATLVGKPGKPVRGTSGPDVVVSGGASIVSTGAGRDVICMTGTTADGYRAKVLSGAGRDRVVARTGNFVIAYLGLGKDSYVGGDQKDHVMGGEPAHGDETVYEDEAPDYISAGSGDDRVHASHEDTIALGAGNDVLQWDGPAGVLSAGEVDGGPGQNLLEVAATDSVGDEPGAWVLDGRAGTLSRDGKTVGSWQRFTGFSVEVQSGVERLLMKGSGREESFRAWRSGVTKPRITIKSRGGDDTINVGGIDTPGDIDLSVDGGPGRDLLHVLGYEFVSASLILDLKAGSYRYQDDDSSATARLARVEDADVGGIPEVTMRGDGAPNRLTVRANQTDWPVFDRCSVVVSGRGGDDRLTLRSSPIQPSWKNCPAPLLRGEAGNDLLVGSLLSERLLGGPGRDVARGGRGRDVCVAETKASCERQ